MLPQIITGVKYGLNLLKYDSAYSGGITSFVNGFLQGLDQQDEPVEVVVLCMEDQKNAIESYLTNVKVDFRCISNDSLWWKLGARISYEVAIRGLSMLYSSVQRLFFSRLCRRLGKQISVLYVPTTVLYPTCFKVPQVLSMHDIQQVHYPEFFTASELKYRSVTYGLSGHLANVLQASSGSMEQDFRTHFGKDGPNQVVIIPEGVNYKQFQPEEPDCTFLRRYNLKEGYLFYPAQLWVHKDHKTLIEGLDRYHQKHGNSPTLVLTGASYSSGESVTAQIKALPHLDIRTLGKVPYEDIISLYQFGGMLIHTSLHESNCLPIFEAAAAGVPVVCSDIGPNQELGDQLRLNLFKAGNPIDLANVLETALGKKDADNDVLVNKLAIEQFDWRLVVEKYLKLFARLG